MVNEAKLRGRIVEMGYTLTSFTEKIGMSRQSFRDKIKGRVEFKASEIMAVSDALEIPYNDVGQYFFYHECPQNGNIQDDSAESFA